MSLADRAKEYIAVSRTITPEGPDIHADPSKPMSVIEDMSPAAFQSMDSDIQSKTHAVNQGDAADVGPEFYSGG